jgi:hypothetical protein
MLSSAQLRTRTRKTAIRAIREYALCTVASVPLAPLCIDTACVSVGRYLDSVESGTEPSFDSLLRKYSECHAAILRGESAPRMLVYRWDRTANAGVGNMVTFMSTALLHAVLFRRALLVDHGSFRHDLRVLLEPPSFDWDLDSATMKLPGLKNLTTAVISRFCKELVEDSAPVLVFVVAPCVMITSLVTDAMFRPFLPLFPARQPALIVGALSHVLFQPGLELRRMSAPLRSRLRDRFVIGVAVRFGGMHNDVFTLVKRGPTSWAMVDVFADCALELASNAGKQKSHVASSLPICTRL